MDEDDEEEEISFSGRFRLRKLMTKEHLMSYVEEIMKLDNKKKKNPSLFMQEKGGFVSNFIRYLC